MHHRTPNVTLSIPCKTAVYFTETDFKGHFLERSLRAEKKNVKAEFHHGFGTRLLSYYVSRQDGSFLNDSYVLNESFSQYIVIKQLDLDLIFVRPRIIHIGV